MKIGKRITALVLACVMLFGMTITASAATTLQLTIKNYESDDKAVIDASVSGDTAIMAVDIADMDPAIAAANLQIVYDTDNLKIDLITNEYAEIDEEVEKYGRLSGMESSATDGTVFWAASKGLSKTGTLFWIVFSAKENAINGDYTITFEKEAQSASFLTDVNRNYIDVEDIILNKGTIEITGGIDPATLKPTVSGPVSAEYTYPTNVSAVEKLSVTASVGTGGMTYQWYKNGAAIDGATKAEYQPIALPTVGESDSYKCVVTNATYTSLSTESQVATIEYKKATLNASMVGLNPSTFVYNGAQQAPSLTFAEGMSNSDATATIVPQTNVGSYDVTINGIGNYEGSVVENWTITEASIVIDATAEVDIYADAPGKSIKPTPVMFASDVATVTYTDLSGEAASLIDFDKTTGMVSVKSGVQLGENEKKTATIEVTVTCEPNYKEAKQTVTVIVAGKKPATVTADPKLTSVTYDAGKSYIATDILGAVTAKDEAQNNLTGGEVTYTIKDQAGNIVTAIQNAGTYTVTATYTDTYYTGTSEAATFTVERAKIDADPVAKTGLVYNGENQTGVTFNTAKGYTIKEGVDVAVNAGSYTITFALDNNHGWTDGTTDDKTITWTIARQAIDAPVAVNNLVYNGAEQIGVPASTDGKYTIFGNTGKNAASYTAKVIPTDNYCWNDTTYGEKEVSWSIAKRTLNVSAEWNYAGEAFTYTGEEKTVAVTLSGADADKVDIAYANNAKTNAGTYVATAVLVPNDADNHTVSYEVEDLTWIINQVALAVPTAKTGLVYTGSAQQGVTYADGLLNYVSAMGVSQTNVGNFSAQFSIIDSDNYKWADSSFDGWVDWSIAPKPLTDALSDKISIRYNDTNAKEYLASAIKTLLEDSNAATTVTITGVTVNDEYNLLAEPTFAGDKVTYAVENGMTEAPEVGKNTAVITIAFISNNYNGETKLNLTVEVTDKNDVSEFMTGAETGTGEYNGQVQTFEFASMPVGYTGTITYTYSADMKDVSTYIVTATYSDETNWAQKKATYTITPATINVKDGAAVEAKTYDGSTSAVVSGVEFDGLFGTDTVAYTVSGQFNDSDVKDAVSVTYIVTLDGAVKNYVMGDNTGMAAATINPLELTDVAVATIEDRTYTGSQIKPTNIAVTSDQTVDSYVLAEGTDYTVAYAENVDAGNGTVVVTTNIGSNYTFAGEVKQTFVIKPATVTVVANPITVTYSGVALPATMISGTATFDNGSVAGTWSWAEQPGVNGGEYTAKAQFTPNDTTNFVAPAAVDVKVTVNKATLTGKPAMNEIKEADKTLADVALSVGELPASGLIYWKDEDGNPIPESELANIKIEANKTYIWVYEPQGDLALNYNKVEGRVVLYATESNIGSYVDILPSANGSVSVNANFVAPGTLVIMTPVASSGYQLQSLTVTDFFGLNVSVTDLGDGKYAFVMPHVSFVTVKASFAPVARNTFIDVPASEWFFAPVYYAYENGLMNGVGDGTRFAPGDNLTRGMLMTILARLDGVNTAGGATWYTKGMEWAKGVGISDGTNPELNITREQAVTMLFRYAQYKGVDVSVGENTNILSYDDAFQISEWAMPAMQWGCGSGMIQGNGGKVNPAGTASRAEIATMLMRFVENVVK